ncbi:MAG: T9SS type A sorting domain-containing protein, partial [Bacteroidota bacterium]
EIVLLDFNLSVGDTIPAGLCGGPGLATCDEIVVRSIDTVEILDGTLRQRINFDLYIRTSFNPGKYEVAWVDGVGSTRGLFDTFENCSILTGRSRSAICFDRLVCMQSTEHLLFNNTENEIYSCDRESIISSTPSLQLPADLFSLYPNPAREQITLEAPEDIRMTQLELTNSSGQIVYQAVIPRSEATALTLQLNTFPQGIYQLRIMTASAHWATLRLVINQ